MRRSDKFKSLILCITLLIAILSLNLSVPQQVFASGKTHYIAVASDRHETTNAIYTAMSGMPSSVEYVCLNGDMANFARGSLPARPDSQPSAGPTAGSGGESAGSSGGENAGKDDPDGEDNTGEESAGNPENGVAGDEGADVITDKDIDVTEDSGTGAYGAGSDDIGGSSGSWNFDAPPPGEWPDFPSGERPVRPPGGGRGQNPYNTSTILAEVQEVFPSLDSSNVSIIYAGHDSNATDDAGIMKNADTSLLPATDGKDTPEISEGQSGLIYTGEDTSYYIYGVSFYDMQNADAGAAAAEAFRNWADSVDPAIPVIVISHVPIHAKRHDNHGASAWNKALNYAATGSDSGTEIIRDVTFVFGHNHTVEKVEYNVNPGEALQAEGDDSESTIYYSYITGGYLRDLHTATLIAISDETISLTKYTGDTESSSLSLPSALSSRNRVKYCIVTFVTGEGSGIESQKMLSGRSASKPGNPVRSGYTFTGWFRDAACTEIYDFSAGVTEDITLYAGWKADSAPVAVNKETKSSSDDAVLASDDEDAGSSDSTKSSPRTGDDSNLKLWMMLVFLSSAEFAIILLIRRKNSIR